jgi:hypothetical protein
MDEKTLKNLAYLVGAIGLVLVGLLFIFGILKVVLGLANFLLPIAFIGAAIYLAYRWLQTKNLEDEEGSDSWQ